MTWVSNAVSVWGKSAGFGWFTLQSALNPKYSQTGAETFFLFFTIALETASISGKIFSKGRYSWKHEARTEIKNNLIWLLAHSAEPLDSRTVFLFTSSLSLGSWLHITDLHKLKKGKSTAACLWRNSSEWDRDRNIRCDAFSCTGWKYQCPEDRSWDNGPFLCATSPQLNFQRCSCHMVSVCVCTRVRVCIT